MTAPRIIGRRVEYANAWLKVIAKDVDLGPPRGVETFYSITTGDYVAVLARTKDGRVPLVRQYRPAVESSSLELPSGGIEDGENPTDAARRELYEETGCRASRLELLGLIAADPGRSSTRQWCFYAEVDHIDPVPPDAPAEGLELTWTDPASLSGLVAGGDFQVGLHVAVVALALARGLLPVSPRDAADRPSEG